MAARLALAALALAAGTVGLAQARSQEAVGGIYTCVDATGRRITSDRPIMSCIDREQRELHRSGTTKRVIGPTLTATEREQREQQAREAEQARQRARDVIRRNQALLNRYPNQAAHDLARREALAQTQAVVDTAQYRLTELAAERRKLEAEMEFYRREPSRAPAKLRQRLEENRQSAEVQNRAIAGQQAERDKINQRFDEELAHLRQLWAAGASSSASAPPPAR